MKLKNEEPLNQSDIFCLVRGKTYLAKTELDSHMGTPSGLTWRRNCWLFPSIMTDSHYNLAKAGFGDVCDLGLFFLS